MLIDAGDALLERFIGAIADEGEADFGVVLDDVDQFVNSLFG